VSRLGSGLGVLLVVVAALGGCGGGSSTPTLDSSLVSVQDERLLRVAERICHVQGAVVNVTSDTAITVIMRWQAFDANDAGIATTRLTVTGVAPGTRVDFETSGFASNDRGLVGCGDIARFERIETTLVPG
jgi:hypothetical protein